MAMVAVGLSHHSAAIGVRERFDIAAADLAEVLQALKLVPGVREAVLVSTCNRTEVYAEVEQEERDSARLREFMATVAKVPLAELEEHLYAHSGEAAIRHVFRVSSSLDSMMVGEAQILGQVKAAVASAQAVELLGGGLGRLFDRAFAVAKRVRRETAIGENHVSVSSAAVELARTIFGDLSDRRVLIVGAGKMGGLTLRHLHGAGVKSVVVANRSPERAQELLRGMPGLATRFAPLDQVVTELEAADIAISSIQAGRFLLDQETARVLQRRRGLRQLLLIDIAVPRSFEPGVHRIENVFLYDLDDLQGVVAENRKGRRSAATAGEVIVAAEARAFVAALAVRSDVAPLIRDLVKHLDQLRARELERHRGVEDHVRVRLDAATRALTNKFAHGAIAELRRLAASNDGAAGIDSLRRALLSAAEPEGEP